MPGLSLGVAVGNNVIRVAFERATRVFPDHPRIEGVMHKQIGEQRRNDAPNAMGNFTFDVILRYRWPAKPRDSQQRVTNHV